MKDTLKRAGCCVNMREWKDWDKTMVIFNVRIHTRKPLSVRLRCETLLGACTGKADVGMTTLGGRTPIYGRPCDSGYSTGQLQS